MRENSRERVVVTLRSNGGEHDGLTVEVSIGTDLEIEFDIDREQIAEVASVMETVANRGGLTYRGETYALVRKD
jgi:hypothetical protein